MAKTLEMSPVEEIIVTDALVDELKTAAEWAYKELDGDITPINVEDTRWKVERMAVCLSLLTRLGYVSVPNKERGFAGTNHAGEVVTR